VSLWDFTPEEGNYAYGFYATDVWDYLDGPDMPPARALVNGSSIVVEGRNLEGPPSLRAVRINPDVHSVLLPEHGVISYAGTPEEGMIRLSDGYHWYRDGTVEEEVFTTGSFLQITPDHVWWIAGLSDTTQNMLVWYDRRSGVHNQTPLSHGGWNYFAVIQNELVGNPYLHNPAFPHDWAWVRYDLDDILAGRGLRSSFIDTVFMYTRYRPRGSIWSENAIIADIFLQSVRTPPIVTVLRSDLTLLRRREVPVSPYWLGLVGSEEACIVATADLIGEHVKRVNVFSAWLHRARPRIWFFPWE